MWHQRKRYIVLGEAILMIDNIARVWEDIAVRHKLFMLWKLQGLTDALKGFVGWP